MDDKKDIYLIYNDINNKVYIGQAKNTKQRFLSHCKPSAATLNNELIGKAIQKYGKEHFNYKILEQQITNYNEREKYWIEFYNSLVPNGYNISKGGEEPPHMVGEQHPEAILSTEQVNQLTQDLKDNILTTQELLNKYGFKSRTSISEFNLGKTYHRNIEYPICPKRYIGKLTDRDVEEIINILKTTNKSYKDIAKDYNVEYRTISRINKGVFHHYNNIQYPIRSKNVKNINA